ncbi:MAG: polymer-forming cytoskeletal protein [Nitrospirae bacterium]|nr:MAG: polymer-forming cytoskeletal protein [Nitrospirota bacterium]
MKPMAPKPHGKIPSSQPPKRSLSKKLQGKRRSSQELVAFFGKGVECRGTITNHGTVQVDGRFEGEIYTRGSLLVGASGVIDAKVRAGTIVSQGTITGDIVAKKQVHLLGTARMEGSLQTPQLLMEEGTTLLTPWTLWMKKSKLSSQSLQRKPINVVQAQGVDQSTLIDTSRPSGP